MMKLSRIIQERIATFVTLCSHGATYGLADGINSNVMAFTRRPCGHRNLEDSKKAMFIQY